MTTIGFMSLQRSVELVGVIALSWLVLPGDAAAQDPFAEARNRLVTERVAAAGVKDSRVLDSIRTTPRHEFVPKSQRDRDLL